MPPQAELDGARGTLESEIGKIRADLQGEGRVACGGDKQPCLEEGGVVLMPAAEILIFRGNQRLDSHFNWAFVIKHAV